MAGKCQICAHKDREEIEGALLGREGSLSVLARRYGVSRDSLWRHKQKHIPASLSKAQALAEVERGDGLLGQMRDLQRRTMVLLVNAEEKDQPRVALAVIAEIRRNMELSARLLSAAVASGQAEMLVSGRGEEGGKPADLSGLTEAEFFALGWLLAKVQGLDLPQPARPAERRALDGLLPVDDAEAWTADDPLDALGQGDARGD